MRFLSDYPKPYFQDSVSKALAAWHLRGNANVALPELRRPLSWGHLSRRRVSCAHLGQNSSQGFSSAIVSEASFLLSSKGRRGSVLRAVLTSGQRPACRVGVEVPHCLAVETVNGLAASCAFASGANGATSNALPAWSEMLALWNAMSSLLISKTSELLLQNRRGAGFFGSYLSAVLSFDTVEKSSWRRYVKCFDWG
jgi:hypothetical protein